MKPHPQTRVSLKRLGAKGSKYDVLWGGAFPPPPPTVPNTNGEFLDMVTGILDGAIGGTFRQRRENVGKTNRNGRRPDPPIPLETL